MALPSTSWLLKPCLAALVAMLWGGNAPMAHATTASVIKLSPDSVSEAFRPRRLALLIGVRNFDDARFRELSFPEKDVADVSSFLKAHNTVEADEQIIMTGAQATASSVVAALDEIERKNTSADDIVIVYLSTHGSLAFENERQLKRYAVMSDSRFDDLARTGISIDYLEARLARLKSSRKALVLALCHSGSGKSALPTAVEAALGGMKGEFLPQPLHEVSSAMMVLSASTWGQPAREDNFLKNDIYTHFLLRGLTEHDANGDGAISLFEAHEYARSHTYDFTRGQQTPSALLNIEGTDPIILNGAVSRPAKPLVFADAERFRSLEVAIDGERKGTLWDPQKLPEGRVRLTLVDPRTPETPLMDHHVYLRGNRSYAVSRLLARPPSFAVELGLKQLPLAALSSELTGEGLLIPGISVRSADVLGSRFNLSASYFARRQSRSMTIEEMATDVRWQMQMIRATIGYAYHPTRRLELNAGLALDHVNLDRLVGNAAFHRPAQNVSLLYPSLVGEARLGEFFDSAYIGLTVSVHPLRRVGLKMDERAASLDVASAGVLGGFSF